MADVNCSEGQIPWGLLACPDCRSTLRPTDGGAGCDACHHDYEAHGSSGLDLRLKAPKKVTVEFELGTPLFGDEAPDFSPLQANSRAEVDYSGFPLPEHLPLEIASHLPRSRGAESRCLDLGCGAGAYRAAVEHAGYHWIGVDYGDTRAPILADGHALPFVSNAFDVVMSLAVLEHIRFPHVFAEEVCRVLRPGGLFLGSVAYLVPFHLDSFYNMTHFGTASVLKHAGFRVERIAPDPRYSGIKAIAYQGLFPGARRSLAYGLAWPLGLAHRLWWATGRWLRPKRFDTTRQHLLASGAFVFVARKPVGLSQE